MRRAAHVTLAASLSLIALLGSGCVPQDRYDQLLTAHRSLQEQIVLTEDERDEALAGLRAAQNQLTQSQGSYNEVQARHDSLNAELRRIENENADYLSRISHLEIGPLPIEVEAAIESLARAHPDLLTFDSRLGMVQFASDFTFDLGSVELKESARETIRGLARILNEPAAASLEVRVIGHTDNMPISRPQTRQAHPTNIHLSVHRAIAVQNALKAASIAPDRIMVAGYGEFRPIVANGAKGAAENRRVEIYLAPMSQAMPSAASAKPITEDSTVSADPDLDEPMK